MKILRFFIKKWLKILLVSEKAVPLHLSWFESGYPNKRIAKSTLSDSLFS